MNNRNVLVIGAGLSGSTIARCLAESNYKVLVIEKRNHIGGNVYDYVNEHGIRIHKYGPHIFHTNNKTVFDYLSRFTEWIDYKHKVVCLLDNNTLVPFPINTTTRKYVPKDKLVDTFIRPYSEKMWGMRLEDISSTILNRVPSRDDDIDLYFPNDSIQVLPKLGYTYMIKKMLEHKNIDVKLNTFYKKEDYKEFHKVFSSGPIDEHYNYKYGELEYRSIKFHDFTLPIKTLFDKPQVNLTNDGPFTRFTEWKSFPGHGTNANFTSLTFEEPCDYKENANERYYPVKDPMGSNKAMFKKYKSIKDDKILFVGRLGRYAYLNMDQAVNSALAVSKNFLSS